MSIFSQHRSRNPSATAWDPQIVLQMDHQHRIEDAFDRAELCELLGDLELAIEWLDLAAALSGGLSRDFRSEADALAMRARPARRGGETAGRELMTHGDLVAISVNGGPGAAAEARRALVAADGSLPTDVRDDLSCS